jgi:mitogen-activated protein kinase organizer 1
MILSGSIDGRVKIWDLRSRAFEPVQEIDDFKDSVTHIDISTQQILVSCLDKNVRLYDLRFGRMQCDFMGEQVTCATLSKDDQCVLVSLLANRLVLLDKLSGEMLNEYSGHVNRTYQVENCLDNSCSKIFSGSEDGFAYVWDLVEAKVKQRLMHDAGGKSVHSLSYHPELDKLLTAQEQFAYLWAVKAEE